MKLGAEPKKVALLGGLLTVAGVVFYINVLSGPSDPRETVTPPPQSAESKQQAEAMTGGPQPGAAQPAKQAPNISRAKSRIAGNQRDFKPQIGSARDEERPDPSKVDPSLRLDLFAKIQAVEYQTSSRSLFQFALSPPTPPAKPTPAVTIKPRMIGPEPPPPPPVAAAPPPEPKAPPIPLKFYGFTSPRRDGTKRAFFLDGEDIVVAAEGETVKRRYKVVRIGINSVVMSDTQFKNDSQTLPIAPEAS